jgi:peptidoglycan hydrolase-like protein with peptidoglycan-binding domain
MTELDGAAAIAGERSLASLAPDDVMTLQRALQRRGLYSGSIDGLVGPITTEALLEAERRRSGRELQAIRDGRVSSALWNELVGAGQRSR